MSGNVFCNFCSKIREIEKPNVYRCIQNRFLVYKLSLIEPRFLVMAKMWKPRAFDTLWAPKEHRPAAIKTLDLLKMIDGIHTDQM